MASKRASGTKAKKTTKARAEPIVLRFFAGKGGVGKTTCAAAEAVFQARAGKRVLVLSTDPAHSLGDALDRKLSRVAKEIPIGTKKGSLFAAEIDADRALQSWMKARRVPLEAAALRGTYLDEDDVSRLFDLSLPGVDELIGLLEIERLAKEHPYDVVVVDTAPTGHTLRLLAMPETLRRIAQVFDDMQSKHRFLAESLGGAWRGDRTDAIIEEIDAEGSGLHASLRDPKRASFRWILLPEELSLEEAKDGTAALVREGMHVDEVLVNRVTPPPDGDCALCEARVAKERAVIARILDELGTFPIRLLRATDEEPRGPGALATFAKSLHAPDRGRSLVAPPEKKHTKTRRREARGIGAEKSRPAGLSANSLMAAIAPKTVRVVLFGGKGGVGKTTCAAAAAIAIAEADPGRRVLAFSTDPAHSLGDALDVPLGDDVRHVPGAPKNLFARELDAEAAFRVEREKYRDAVDDLFDRLRGGSSMDASFDRAVVQDLIDLAPPGLDELFAMISVVNAIVAPPSEKDRFDLVLLDTAPTGHTLRLLELPKAALEWVHALLQILLKYRRAIGLGDLAQDLVKIAGELRRLTEVLHDPTRCRFVAVTRAAELPRVETERLLRSLSELEIAAPFVVVNALTPRGCTRCDRIAAREEKEVRLLAGACSKRARCAILGTPARAEPPRGVDELRAFARTWSTIAE